MHLVGVNSTKKPLRGATAQFKKPHNHIRKNFTTLSVSNFYKFALGEKVYRKKLSFGEFQAPLNFKSKNPVLWSPEIEKKFLFLKVNFASHIKEIFFLSWLK